MSGPQQLSELKYGCGMSLGGTIARTATNKNKNLRFLALKGIKDTCLGFGNLVMMLGCCFLGHSSIDGGLLMDEGEPGVSYFGASFGGPYTPRLVEATKPSGAIRSGRGRESGC